MWLSGKPIFVDGVQAAEILVSKSQPHYTIRNQRPNGTIGICFTCNHLAEVKPWLDLNIPGWVQHNINATGQKPKRDTALESR